MNMKERVHKEREMSECCECGSGREFLKKGCCPINDKSYPQAGLRSRIRVFRTYPCVLVGSGHFVQIRVGNTSFGKLKSGYGFSKGSDTDPVSFEESKSRFLV